MTSKEDKLESLILRFNKIILSVVYVFGTLRKKFNGILLDERKYKQIIFLIIISTGSILWFFRVLIPLGFFHNIYSGVVWWPDFMAYHDGASSFLSGMPVYDTGYIYFPLSLLIFLPFAYFSLYQAYFLFTVINVLLVIATTLAISKILTSYEISLSRFQILLLFLAILLAYPVSISITHGQINILILYLTTLFYYYLFINKNIYLFRKL